MQIVYKSYSVLCFPDRPMKVGESWISRKGTILVKGGGGYDPPYQLFVSHGMLLFLSTVYMRTIMG